MVFPAKPIEEDAADNEHLDEEQPQVLKYLFSSKGSEYMVDKTLAPEAGITHDVFGEEEEEAEAAAEDEDEDGEGAEEKVKDILDSKHVFVPEVVREPRMHYFKVPRLGSYMAIPLVYNSCLSVEALAAAEEDFYSTTKRLEEQAKEREEYEDLKKAQDSSAVNETGEPIEEEEREWETIEFAPYQTTEERWVLSLDTLGQDR